MTKTQMMKAVEVLEVHLKWMKADAEGDDAESFMGNMKDARDGLEKIIEVYE